SARDAQEAREKAEAVERQRQVERKSLELQQKRRQLEAEIARMRSAFDLEEIALLRHAKQTEFQENQLTLDRKEMGRVRCADLLSAPQARTVKGLA
ncbi:MAG: hypothetical protein WCA99_15845, partial [Candidatus Sulfotelmatobacter sp.]